MGDSGAVHLISSHSGADGTRAIPFCLLPFAFLCVPSIHVYIPSAVIGLAQSPRPFFVYIVTSETEEFSPGTENIYEQGD
jgi:hypothetical protein